MAATLSRRDFIKVSLTAGGAALFSFYLDACVPHPSVATSTPTALPTAVPPFRPNLFIEIDRSSVVTLRVHRSEMGQGVRTSLAMILAEELEVDWAHVRVEQMDAESQLNQITSGSGSIEINYDALRQAGAAVRALLVQAAAQTWNVPAEACKADQGAVLQVSTGKMLSYGDLASKAATIPSAPTGALKDPGAFRLIGQSVPRYDGPDIVTGRAIYGLDVRVPGMLFATVSRPPMIGGKVTAFDAASAKAVPGVRAVVQIGRGVAVVAENTWAAIQGRAALKITWDESSAASFSSASIRQKLVDVVNKAIAAETPSSLSTLEAVYETPYLAHATMEPPNCVADVRADHCEIWAPTQNPGDVESYVRNALRLPTTVHVTLLGGGFGRKLEVDYPLEAAEISKAVGAPVQVVWTRDDDLQHDFYRQISYHSMKAGWDSKGQVQYWRHYMGGQAINGIAYRSGKEVLDEGINLLYGVSGIVTESFAVPAPVPTGPWRGVMSGPNALANECFFDEVAAALKQDPYRMRMQLLDPASPVSGVLRAAATNANWGSPLAAGHGQGIACQVYHGVPIAMVAEVSVESGAPTVHKIVSAINCGRVINPDMVVQQVEGGIAFGLTSLLKGAITFENGQAQQANFDDYPLLQISEMPEVDVHIIPDDRAPLGVGEMAVPPVVPAVLNAIYAVTGKRIRHAPIVKGDL